MSFLGGWCTAFALGIMTGFLLTVGDGVFFGIVGPGIQISFAWLRCPGWAGRVQFRVALFICSRLADIGGGV